VAGPAWARVFSAAAPGPTVPVMTTTAPHLLHVDSSIQGDRSVTRALSRRVVDGWLAANPGGSVNYRDLAASPPPHLGADAWDARFVPADQHSDAHAEAFALSRELIGEVEAADAIVLGLPLYNFGPPTSVKAWVDHLVFPGLSVKDDMSEGLLTGRRVIAVVARGGSYAEGTPRHGWDHAEQWLTHILSMVGLTPEFVATVAEVRPALAHLQPQAEASRAAAHSAIDKIWARAAA